MALEFTDDLLKDLYSETIREFNLVENDHLLSDELKDIDIRYKILEEISRGGMKVIFKSIDKITDRDVAIAFPLDEKNNNALLREARITSCLDHPNIIPVYDIGFNIDQKPFFSMKLIVGQSFKHFFEEKNDIKSNLHSQLLSFVKICDAVSYAHSKGIIHLDLKPENILVDGSGKVYICDWGMAKILDAVCEVSELNRYSFDEVERSSITLNGELKGTPGFMAPEQVSTGFKKSVLTDIYSLGAILYNMITGQAPFDGPVEEVISKTLKNDFIEPSKLSISWEVPLSLNKIIMKAMELNGEDRYQSATELKTEIELFLSGRATVIENAGPLKKLSYFYKRNRIFSVCVLALILTSISLSLIFLNQKGYVERSKAIIAKDYANSKELALREIKKKELLLSDPRVKKIILNSSENLFISPIKSSNRSIELLESFNLDNKNSQWGCIQLAYTYFIRQEFGKAYDLFKLHPKEAEDLRLLCEKYAPKLNDNILSGEDLGYLIEELFTLPYRSRVAFKMLSYDAEKRTSTFEHSKAVYYLLRCLNPNLSKDDFRFYPSKKLLRINSSSLNKVSFPLSKLIRWSNKNKRVSVLRGLQLVELDIRDSAISDFKELLGLDFEVLRISKFPMKSFECISEFRNLQKIFINQDEYTKEEFVKIPLLINVRSTPHNE